jgi:DNA ligase-1
MVHVEDSLKSFFEAEPDAFLDGEAFAYDLRQHLNEIMKLTRRTVNITQADLDRSRELIKYHVYDGANFSGTTISTPYKERKAIIDLIVREHEYLELVTTTEINNEEEMWALYNEIISDGSEGAIVRFPDSPYEHKRSSNLLKLKPCDTDDFLVKDIQEGQGNWSGRAKIIVCETDDGRQFSATFKGNMEQAKYCLDNKYKYIGKKYELTYNGKTGLGAGLPQYAQMDWENSVSSEEK